jgi:hypothetical protein
MNAVGTRVIRINGVNVTVSQNADPAGNSNMARQSPTSFQTLPPIHSSGGSHISKNTKSYSAAYGREEAHSMQNNGLL